MLVGPVGDSEVGGRLSPFDPVLSAERLAFMIEDARVKYCLTPRTSVSRALPPGEAQAAAPGRDWAADRS